MLSPRRLSWTLLLTLLLQIPAATAGDVKIWEEDVVMPSYRLDPPDKNPMFYKNESYQGAQKRIYPYPFQEHVTNIKEEQSFRFLFLENDYIKLSILPEIGGRLFSAVDKTNGYEIFYHQNVIKPALIGMLGAWISGGVEWCVFHHHRNTTHMPVDYTLTENPDGSKTIWFGETERRHRMKWLIGITLHPDRSYIEASVRLLNRTNLAHSILYWANVAVHVDENYQVIFPPSVQYATYHSKNDFAHWPIGAETYQGTDYNGVDLSWWKNHPEPISFFAWDLQEDFMGGYDHGRNAGVAHVGNHHVVAGAKLWEWSPGPRGRMWDKILTDADGPYAELMVGAFSNNQPDYSWIKPGEVKTFKQYWYPIRDIGGFKKANLDAAANLEVEDSVVRFGFNTTAEYKDARVILTSPEGSLFEKTIDISPAQAFLGEYDISEDLAPTDLLVALYDSSGTLLVSHRPSEPEYDPELPETVKPPADPKEITTVEELYLTGLRVQQIHSPSVNPDDYFKEALRRDPEDVRANTIVGVNLNRRGLYREAERHLRTAVKRLSSEYTRPSTAEPEYHLGLSLTAQERLDEAYDSFYKATWDYSFHSMAYQQLAELSCRKGEFKTALEQINRAISTNSLNTRMRSTRAAILRKIGRLNKARTEAHSVLDDDPLDFFAGNELALSSRDSNQADRFRRLRTLMRDSVQSYLELATDYGRLGLWSDSISVLKRAVDMEMAPAARYPMVHYYLGYYSQKAGDNDQAEAHFANAAGMPPDYCFPFRLESIAVLETALDLNPRDSRAHYYLGNLLYEIQPQTAIEAWQESSRLDPAFALAHRNLGWAYYRRENDLTRGIVSYEKAVEANPEDPRLHAELDQLYESANVSPAERLAQLNKNPKSVVSRNYSFVRQIRLQVLTGEYGKAIASLSSNHFHVREGGGNIHDVFVDAHLLRGLALHRQTEYESALEDFLKAAEYPENLSVGVPPRDRRAPQVAYYTGLAYQSLGQGGQARAYFKRAAAAGELPWPDTQFFQALALEQLGLNDQASRIYDQLIQQGEQLLAATRQVDFFAKFGEQETARQRQATGHYLIGLGRYGKGNRDASRSSFVQSVELNASNAWAKLFGELAALPTMDDGP